MWKAVSNGWTPPRIITENDYYSIRDNKDNDKLVNYKVNIAEIHMNASRVVGYIQSVDHLRSKGYALPYNDLSIDELIKKRWIEIK